MKDLLNESLMASLAMVQPDARMKMEKPITPDAGYDCGRGACSGRCGGNCSGNCGSNCKGGVVF